VWYLPASNRCSIRLRYPPAPRYINSTFVIKKREGKKRQRERGARAKRATVLHARHACSLGSRHLSQSESISATMLFFARGLPGGVLCPAALADLALSSPVLVMTAAGVSISSTGAAVTVVPGVVLGGGSGLAERKRGWMLSSGEHEARRRCWKESCEIIDSLEARLVCKRED
jgi:hypothetical protein